MSKKTTFPCMKDTLGEVITSVVMKTPKGVPKQHSEKMTGNGRKIHKHNSKEKDYISYPERDGRELLTSNIS